MASRSAYAAGGSHGSMQTLMGVSKRFLAYWVGAFVRYTNLSGTPFVGRPLARTRHYFTAGLAMSWTLG